MSSLLQKLVGAIGGPLSGFLTFVLDWLWGKAKEAILFFMRRRDERKEVDKIVDKINSPDLGEQLEGIEDAEDRLNRNT